MKISDIRRKNLNDLIGRHGERGRIIDFAERHGLDASYISQLLNKHRGMGEKAARKIEQVIGLAPGALDNPITDQDFDISPLKPDEIELLRGYQSASPEIKKAVLRIFQPDQD